MQNSRERAAHWRPLWASDALWRRGHGLSEQLLCLLRGSRGISPLLPRRSRWPILTGKERRQHHPTPDLWEELASLSGLKPIACTPCYSIQLSLGAGDGHGPREMASLQLILIRLILHPWNQLRRMAPHQLLWTPRNLKIFLLPMTMVGLSMQNKQKAADWEENSAFMHFLPSSQSFLFFTARELLKAATGQRLGKRERY